MDSLNEILSRKDFDEPPEVKAIKKYVREQFDESVAVTVREKEIIIVAPNAALANTLRLRVLALRKIAGDKKRMVFRIGK
ncbi:MAG TPA: hypothetical protein VLG47_01835 [Candidatus Saccharimonadales bacterium]|nr:hypothetical protein [Candidatus Saccharimonadales bacterium]